MINKAANTFFKVRNTPFKNYFTLEKAAALLDVSKGELLYEVINSSVLHGFRTPDGEVFLHPKGVLRKVRRAKKVLLMAIDRKFRKFEERVLKKEEKISLS